MWHVDSGCCSREFPGRAPARLLTDLLMVDKYPLRIRNMENRRRKEIEARTKIPELARGVSD
jgi:hypothetical protein